MLQWTCPSVVRHRQSVAYCASYRKTEEADRIWPIGNRRITWSFTSHAPERSRSPICLWAQYIENSWRCYLATVANY